jgi:hypothetical protein
VKAIALVLVLVVAIRAHVPVVVYGCPFSIPLLPLAAAVVLSAALVVLAVRLAVKCNRRPRIYWRAVYA